MNNHLSPWSSWDIKSINAVMHLHHPVEVKVGVFNDFDKAYAENLHPHRRVNRYGLHAADGSYFMGKLRMILSTLGAHFWPI